MKKQNQRKKKRTKPKEANLKILNRMKKTQ